eukprot:MONOS_15978.1-p1 / transcript=MONOS_15978.1 / gene=MONOS_15978 / organism=Monocercomonoides_exilis_PA203 / gene_product=unspecified product / transcript_product=unspecified product / location=Mono_scaffold01440:307-3226(-) / protein_length=973 / sequence_SO=supercontig / SO=protein_coding / is_pseudo=false
MRERNYDFIPPVSVPNSPILSPTRPGFFSPPPSAPPSSPFSHPLSPSNSSLIPIPSSPLRISTSEQIYDEIAIAPMLRSSSEQEEIAEKEKEDISDEEKDNEQKTDSITSWLTNFFENDDVPVVDFFTTKLMTLPPQPTLKHLRPFKHQSPYPRPLFDSKMENLNEKCIQFMESTNYTAEKTKRISKSRTSKITSNSTHAQSNRACSKNEITKHNKTKRGKRSHKNKKNEEIVHDTHSNISTSNCCSTLHYTSASVSSSEATLIEQSKSIASASSSQNSTEDPFDLEAIPIDEILAEVLNESSSDDCKKMENEKKEEKDENEETENECVKFKSVKSKKLRRRKRVTKKSTIKINTEIESAFPSIRPQRKAKEECLNKMAIITKSYAIQKEKKKNDEDYVPLSESDISDSSSEITDSISSTSSSNICSLSYSSFEDSDETVTDNNFISSSSDIVKRKKKITLQYSSSMKSKPKLRKKSVLCSEDNISLLKEKLNEIESKPKSLNDTATDNIELAKVVDLEDMYGAFNHSELKELSRPLTQSSSPALTTARFSLDSPTKLSEILRDHSIEELEPYFDDGLPFSKDTVKNHCWAFKMYMDYCQTRKIEPWPVQAKPIYGFVKLLGIGAGYNYKSVQCSIINGIFQISELRTGVPIDEKVRKSMNRAMCEVQKFVELKKERKRRSKFNEIDEDLKWQKQPLIVTDLEWILKCYPDWVVEKPLEASLFLFALSTGARAHTCSHIRLQDIVRVFCKENSSFVKVTINLECGKGVRGDDHCVTVEGDIAYKSTLNIVWWLEQFLVEEYGLSLTEFDEWDLGQLGPQYLWGIRKGAMRVRLQKRAKQAGYPENIFGFHSLRSGFICSALIKGRSDPSKKDSIIEATALVGNWQAGSAAQWNYVKETEKSIVVASRLLVPNEDVESDELFDKSLTEPSVYHNIKLNEPSWKIDSIISTFDFYVLEILKYACSQRHYPYSCVI